MVMATHPSVVAGGVTICTRSPLGSAADSNGEDGSIRCLVELATSFASRLHQSKSAKGSGSQRQPQRVSTKLSPGRLMHTSVTSGLPRIGRNARSVSSSADISAAVLTAAGNWTQLIHRSEIKIACRQHLDTIAVFLHDGRRNVDGALEHLGHDVAGPRWTVDHRSIAVVGLRRPLHRAVDHRDEDRRAEALPEMTVHLARQS